MQHELDFLVYRLEVVELWPDSERKQAVLAAIWQRMAAVSGKVERELHAHAAF